MNDHYIHNITSNDFCVSCGCHTKRKVGLEAVCDGCIEIWNYNSEKRKDNEQSTDSKKS